MNQEPKSARIDARLPESVHALLQHAAALQGRSLSDFVVSSAREAAEKAIARHAVLDLTADDQERFMTAIQSPAPLTSGMKRAANRHRSLVEPS